VTTTSTGVPTRERPGPSALGSSPEAETGRTFRYLVLFQGTAILDGYHTVVSSPPVMAAIDQPPDDLTAWTWLASRLFLALFLLASWWVRVGEGERSERPLAAWAVLENLGYRHLNDASRHGNAPFPSG
jgi:hypothetical protein